MAWRQSSRLFFFVTLAVLGGYLALALPGDHRGRQVDLSVPLADCSIPIQQPEPNGLYSSDWQVFKNVAEAEQFVCHKAKYPRSLGDWHLEGIDALRLQPATIRSANIWTLNFRYTLGEYGTARARYLAVTMRGGAKLVRRLDDRTERMSLNCQRVDMIRSRGRMGYVSLNWQDGGLPFEASAELDSDFDLSDLMAILRSIR